MIYEVEVLNLAHRLEDAVFHDINLKVKLNVSSELPAYWRFGISGICDIYNNEKGEVHCRSQFAPPQDVMSVLENPLRDSFRRKYMKASRAYDDNLLDHDVNPILETWALAVYNLAPERLSNRENHASSLIKL
ncbi:hypothetical protein VTJ83DRAFT_4308 [Remersonia thermophila]|uniref:Uncharacterized protein n=1 Tax=Remersonia thermophila TaxID=72144 RepID=A0ABR4D9L9_9PEZI